MLFAFLFSCTKEVKIDIPGHKEKLVIDGQIETGLPPIVLLSLSRNIYAPTDVNAFLNSFVQGAVVTVSDGNTTVQLDEFCSDNLSPAELDQLASILGIEPALLSTVSICGYTTTNPAVFGAVGKSYTLTVNYQGETYTSTTEIVAPTPLNSIWWKADAPLTHHGFVWANLSDPVNQYDAYQWESRIISIDTLTGAPKDAFFKKTRGPVFDDEFFDGLTFDFFYDNPSGYGESVPDSIRGRYVYGDTVVIKFSKMDAKVYEYLEKKYTQLATGGNPFATPTNIPTNIEGGALGLWAGFSPVYDTVICVP